MNEIKCKEEIKKERIIKIPLVVIQIFLIVSITFIISAFFGVLNTETVSAQSSSSVEITKCYVASSGPGACTDVLASQCDALESGGDGNCQQTLCSQVTQCKLGCGFDKNTGTCTPNTPKAVCDNSGNCEFIEDPFCNDNVCNQGCCILGLNAQFVTQDRCIILSQQTGLIYDFDSSVESAVQCLRKVTELDEGACVFPTNQGENSCIFTTQIECDENIKGNFYDNKLCTNSNLNTICEKQDSASCSESRDGVYLIDTCGNRANIYDEGKKNNQDYWEEVVPINEACNPNSNNFNSGSCGNCNYELGSICGSYRPSEDTGNLAGFTCRDLNCRDSDGKKRINGESWCVYQGSVGGVSFSGNELSSDTVGSRHLREYCVNGEIEQDLCSDGRREVCAANEVPPIPSTVIAMVPHVCVTAIPAATLEIATPVITAL